jgi:cell division protein FtsQ
MEFRKAKKAGKKTKRAALIVAGLVSVLVIAGIALLGKKYLFIRDINFYGNRHLTNAELMSLTRLSQKEPLFSVTTGDIYKRLKSSPWIKDALVRKDLSGRITVYLTEAVAVAVLQESHKSYLVDGGGTRLEELNPEPLYFLPVVKINPSLHREAYLDAVELARVLNERKVAAHGGNIELTGTRSEDVTMTVDEVPIKIGAGDLDKKLDKLDFVREELAKREMPVEYIDLRFADRIVVKPLKQQIKTPDHKSKTTGKTRKKTKPKSTGHKKGNKKVAGGKAKRHVG